jgi:hypothetical protein
MYYDPDTVPEDSRQPWARAGIEPGREGLAENGGLNSSYCNAVSEGGPRNGVLTAIEDFLAESGEEISLTVLPVMYGLGILVPARRLAAHPELGAVIDRWPPAEGWEELVRLAEEQRILAAIDRQAAVRRERDRDGERVSPA